MNTYYSMLGRLLDERTPIRRDGYYILYEDDRAGYASSAPEETEIVDAERFVNVLVDGCKEVIRAFAGGSDNSGVYAFNLYADDHSTFFIYMNTLERFEETLKQYPNKREPRELTSLKYSLGDFDFQFDQEHMGEHGRIVEAFETLAYQVMDLEEDNAEEIEDAAPVIAFEAGIIKSGYRLLALKAVQRLIGEKAFAPLNKTDDFIAFAATGDDYIDYSLVMRRTIDSALFDDVFPEVREKDEAFREEMARHRHMSVSEYLDYWSDARYDRNRVGSPFTYLKSEYDVFLQLERYGNALARECLARLRTIAEKASLTGEDFDGICFYVEALYFCGPLTGDQQAACLDIAGRVGRLTDELNDTVRELELLSRQEEP